MPYGILSKNRYRTSDTTLYCNYRIAANEIKKKKHNNNNNNNCRTYCDYGMKDGRSGDVLIPMTRVKTWMDRVKRKCKIEESDEIIAGNKAGSRKKDWKNFLYD